MLYFLVFFCICCLNPEAQYLASGSKDNDIKIWNTKLYQVSCTLSGHASAVTCVKWGGEGLIYSASQDRTIKVWRLDENRSN
uniref:Uncharacterized protein n=1 Tax=Romanomermis culicivorax TaxID=13658 RepID=A0A915KC87_ROMCU